jgi:hypothetical protein
MMVFCRFRERPNRPMDILPDRVEQGWRFSHTAGTLQQKVAFRFLAEPLRVVRVGYV